MITSLYFLGFALVAFGMARDATPGNRVAVASVWAGVAVLLYVVILVAAKVLP